MFNSDPRTNGEYWFLREYGANFQVIFDVGANTGQYAQQALDACPKAHIFCFEPHPISFKELRERFQNQPRVHTVRKALGSEQGTVPLFDHSSSQGSEHATLVSGVIETIHDDLSGQVTVDVLTLDDFVASSGLTNVDFIKIDAEGSEGAILRGATNVIAQHRPKAIQIEFNEMNLLSKFTMLELASLLNGYSLYRLLPSALVRIEDLWAIENKIFSYQNLLALRKDGIIVE